MTKVPEAPDDIDTVREYRHEGQQITKRPGLYYTRRSGDALPVRDS